MRRDILIASCVGFFWLTCIAGAQTSASSSDRPIYRNHPYGYVVKLPPGITYTRSIPPNPNHGFSVVLHSGDRLWVDASYTDSPSNEEESGVITSGCHLEDKRTTTLDRQAALALRFTCPATADQSAYTELLTFTVHRQGDRSPTDYQVGLRVYGASIPVMEKALFNGLIAGFGFGE
jgi:hypothetical protein